MASAAPRIDRYLRQVARELAAGPERVCARFPEGLIVVQGSPAADPDSVASSLGYGFLLHEERLYKAEQAGARERGSGTLPRAERSLIVPRVPIPEVELRLRPEVLVLLKRADVGTILTADEPALDFSAYPPERLSLVLVDTDGRDLPSTLRERVVEIVDHHPGAETLTGTARTIVAPVGSACTLVAEQIFERMPGLVEQRLAVLLLGPILLDTANLAAAAGRVSEPDRRVAGRLRSLAGTGAEGLFEEMEGARRLSEGLSGSELLRRDYKESEAGGLRYGIAVVPVSFREWQKRELDAEQCLRELAARRGVNVLAVLFAYRDGGGAFRRQLLLRVRGLKRYQALVSFLRGLPLGLRALSDPAAQLQGAPAAQLRGAPAAQLQGAPAAPGQVPSDARDWSGGVFVQEDVGFSRKRFEPALRRFLSTRGSEDGGR